MSGSASMEPEGRNLVRVAAFGVLAMLGPPAAAGLVALTQPERGFRLEGLGPFLVACAVVVATAALLATAARSQPLAIGVMTSAAFVVGSLVREGSLEGAAIVLAAGLVGGFIADRGAGGAFRSRRELHILLVIAALLSPPLALAARLGPTQASSGLSGLPALASAIPRGDIAAGYVLHGRPGRFLENADLVRIERRGIGSWVSTGSIRLPESCRFPDMIDGTDRPDVFLRAPVASGIRMASADVARACYVGAERVVAGIAPPGTTRIEAVTIAGEEVDVPVGVGGAYVVLLEEGTIAANFVRVTFWDTRGTLLDSKPLTGPGDYANLAFLSGLIGRPALPANARPEVTVSKYIITPREFELLCRAKPPHGDGFVTIGIVRREDGATREVVVGTGMPLSSGHPRPDPPIVRPSRGTPCFVV